MAARLRIRHLWPDLTPAREHAAVRRLLAGGMLSALGGSMTSFAVVLQIYDVTRSTLAVGLLGLTFVPVLVVGLFGGSVADAVDRRKLVLLTSVGLMAVSAGFAAQAFVHSRVLWLLYLLAGAQAVLQAARAPARRTFLPRLVPPEQLTAAIALSTLTGRVTMLFGPLLAGLVAGAWGLRTCYAIDAVSFLASLYAVFRVPAMPAAKPSSRRPSLHATVEGLTFIRQRPTLVGAFLTDLDAMLLGLPVAVFPALNAAHFGGRAATLGLLNAAVGAGGLLAAGLSGPTVRAARQGAGMLAGTMIWGAAIAGFGLTRSLAGALVLLAVAGAADTLTVTFRAAMVQAVTPDSFRGRVSSVEYIIGTGGAPLGNVETGTVASLTSPVVAAVSGGVACFALAAAIGFGFPAFTRYRAGTSLGGHGAGGDRQPGPVPVRDLRGRRARRVRRVPAGRQADGADPHRDR